MFGGDEEDSGGALNNSEILTTFNSLHLFFLSNNFLYTQEHSATLNNTFRNFFHLLPTITTSSALNNSETLTTTFN